MIKQALSSWKGEPVPYSTIPQIADQSSLKDRVAIVTGASRGIGREKSLHLARNGAKVVINYAGNAEKAEELARNGAKVSSLKDRVAIVTGASRGIGKEIVLHLARKGAKVVINYAGNAEKAEEVASIINKDRDTVRAMTCKADVSKACEVSSLFDVAEQAFGALHIVVNNSGIVEPKWTPLVDTSEELWESILNVNCKGAFLCSREAANRVVKGSGGRIINITSSIVAKLTTGNAAYGASKAAVETMTKILAKELRGTKIAANCVAPGSVATDMLFTANNYDAIQRAAEAAPLERMGVVSDVAPVVAFVAMKESGLMLRLFGQRWPCINPKGVNICASKLFLFSYKNY